MDIAAFLARCYDEDEAAAMESKNAPADAMRFLDADRYTQDLAWLIDADRVLREVAAGRKRLAEHAPVVADGGPA